MSGDILIRDYVSPDYPGLRKVWAECGMGSPERSDDALCIANTLRIGGKLWAIMMCTSSESPNVYLSHLKNHDLNNEVFNA